MMNSGIILYMLLGSLAYIVGYATEFLFLAVLYVIIKLMRS